MLLEVGVFTADGELCLVTFSKKSPPSPFSNNGVNLSNQLAQPFLNGGRLGLPHAMTGWFHHQLIEISLDGVLRLVFRAIISTTLYCLPAIFGAASRCNGNLISLPAPAWHCLKSLRTSRRSLGSSCTGITGPLMVARPIAGFLVCRGSTSDVFEGQSRNMRATVAIGRLPDGRANAEHDVARHPVVGRSGAILASAGAATCVFCLCCPAF